jgi:hypothetical protein
VRVDPTYLQELVLFKSTHRSLGTRGGSLVS